METMKVDLPAELKSEFNEMLKDFSEKRHVQILARSETPVENQPRH